MLLVGPTGVRQDAVGEDLGALFERYRFAISDATTLTEAGYVHGEDVGKSAAEAFCSRADYDLESRAARHAFMLMEIDKINRDEHERLDRATTSPAKGCSRRFLKMLEGTLANVPRQGERKHPEQQYIQVDTSHILFICGGTFRGTGSGRQASWDGR